MVAQGEAAELSLLEQRGQPIGYEPPGAVTMLDPKASREPVDLDEATLFFGRDTHKVKLPEKEVNDAFIVGVEPNRNYLVEIDDEELWEVKSDPGGILYFPGLKGSVGVRFSPAKVIP